MHNLHNTLFSLVLDRSMIKNYILVELVDIEEDLLRCNATALTAFTQLS